MRFRSLIFREFRLSKKGIILQAGLLPAWIALTWGILFSSNSFGDELQRIVDIIIIMTALIGSMSLLLDENFKSDINSGWLGHSYALPIKPFERAAARFVRRLSVCLGCHLLSLCNAAAVCAYTGKEFGADQIVWHIAVLSAVMLTALPNDIFILRARSGAELKKMQTRAGLVTAGGMVVIVAVVFIANGVDLEKLAGSEALFELPVFTAGALAWAVPLLLAVTAASFFASYFSMKSAYRSAYRSAYLGTAKAEKETAEIKQNALGLSQATTLAKTDGAVGLLYKELKQSRIVFIFAALTPVLLAAYPFCFSAIEAMTGSVGVIEVFENATNIFIRMLMCVMGIFIASGLMGEVFKGDDKKLWAYFIVATPQGVKGFMYRKYVVTLMVNLTYMISGIFTESLLATVYYFVTGNELTANMTSLYVSGVFLLLIISALDIPFMVRFGSKKGSIVKMIIMLSVCAAGVAVYNLIPEDIRTKLTDAVVSFFNGERAAGVLMLIMSILPYIALAAFWCSYKIACGVFMKGVNEYDK